MARIRRRATSRTKAPLFALPWAPRQLVAAAIGGLFLAAVAGAYSLSVINESHAAELAYAVFPGNPKAASRLADLEIGRSAREAEANSPAGERAPGTDPRAGSLAALVVPPQSARKVRDLSLEGLRATPLSSGALRALATLERRPEQRKALLDLALQVSRRDVIATLQRSEFDLRRNDVDAALRGYDRALRVSPRAGPVVFPVLLGATELPQLRVKLQAMLAANPVWTEDLVRFALANPASIPLLSRIVGALPKGSQALDPGYGQQIVDRLAVQRRYPEAFAAYAAYSPRPADPGDLLREAFRPIDWLLLDNYDTSARPLGGPRDGVELRSSAGREGEVARLLTAQQPGPRALRLRLTQAEGSDGRLIGTIFCLDGDAERILVRNELPVRSGSAAIGYVVPAAACPYQWVILSLAAGDEAVAVVLQSVAITRGAVAAPSETPSSRRTAR